MALPNVADGLQNKYRHIAALARGQAAAAATGIASALTDLLGREPGDRPGRETVTAAHVLGVAYAEPGYGTGGLRVTA